MPRFIAVHTLPDLTEEQLRAMLMSGKPEYPPNVDWKLTYCAFEDHMFCCEWQAPDKQTLEQVFKEQKTPFDAIFPVKLLDWSTKTLTE